MRRARPPRGIPPPLELLCLNILWSLEQATVKQVRAAFAERRPLAYTTVMTVLDRLARRGLITRRKSGRAYIYTPAVSREAVRRLALQEFLDSYFESSPDQLLQFLQASTRAVLSGSTALDPVLL